MEVGGPRAESPVKLWVTLAGRESEITFDTRGGRLVLEADGRPIEADFVELPDGEVYSLLIEGRSHVVRVEPTSEGLEVELRGLRFPVEVRHPLEKLLQATAGSRTTGRGETLIAPMPGVVVAIRTKPGDTVKSGQAVIVVEAMKMQNELTVAHDGVVQEVLVTERAAVSAGQPLVRIAPAGPA